MLVHERQSIQLYVYFIIKTRCVSESQMPSILVNSKNGHGHKDKYFNTSRNDPLQYGTNNK